MRSLTRVEVQSNGALQREAELIKEVVEEIVSLGKKLGGEGFDDMDVRDKEESIDSGPAELTEDDQLEMTGPEMLPGDDDEDLEEAVPKISPLWRTWQKDSGYLDRPSTSSMIWTPLCYGH
ncbi:hypothetical protein M514_02365 [Trichuris suis]|uniref:Uncharacterized protein n=1 Tax=Trichuris suis TaxID=68888 RepID=A0A085NBP3_9BILA|nr:hypothetical protein M514_02365 [Trichuris suis]